MTIYLVYKKSNKLKKDDNNIVIIKQGFSLIAGIFGVIWALYNRLWSLAIILLFINFIMTSNILPININNVVFIINMFTSMILLVFASDIREYFLIKEGMYIDDIIVAKSEEEAELKYFLRCKEVLV